MIEIIINMYMKFLIFIKPYVSILLNHAWIIQKS
jgi:hypothetical protein